MVVNSGFIKFSSYMGKFLIGYSLQEDGDTEMATDITVVGYYGYYEEPHLKDSSISKMG